MIEIDHRDGCVVFAVRVAPRGNREAVEGEHSGALKVRLTAPPVEGRANEALRRLLAKHLHVPLNAIEIVAGKSSRTKRVAVAGVWPAQVLALCVERKKSR
jgi:uncharacterized protein